MVKTVSIELPIDVYEKLKTIAKEVETQDNRATAPPYFFQIMEKKRIYGMDDDYADLFIWVSNHDGEETYHPDAVEEDFDEDKFHKVYYKDEYVYKNAFFSEKAIKRHIELNHYHYSEPKTFLTHAFRNPELELFFQFLKHLK
ncbi:MAG: hypothetical protein ACRBF0_19905 [Calditrichia bacterium]